MTTDEELIEIFEFDKWMNVTQGKIILLDERFANKTERENPNLHVYGVREEENPDWNGIHISKPGGELDFIQTIEKNVWVNRIMEFITDFPIPHLENNGIINLMNGDTSTPWDVNNGDLSIQTWVNDMFELS